MGVILAVTLTPCLVDASGNDPYYSDMNGAYPSSNSDLRRFNQRRSSSWTTHTGKREDLQLRKNAGLPNVGISTYANGKPVEWETYMSKPVYEPQPDLSNRVRTAWVEEGESPSPSSSPSPKTSPSSSPKREENTAWGMKSDKTDNGNWRIRNSNWVDHKNSI